jgi:hypothetical protein
MRVEHAGACLGVLGCYFLEIFDSATSRFYFGRILQTMQQDISGFRYFYWRGKDVAKPRHFLCEKIEGKKNGISFGRAVYDASLALGKVSAMWGGKTLS